MTVARREMWTLANMLVTIHGPDAEAYADRRLAEVLEDGHSGNIVVWRAVRNLIEEIRAEQEADRQS